MAENCAICKCVLNRNGEYAKPTQQGRSHATKHHYVSERFFGRSGNRKRTIRERLFEQCPWGIEGNTDVYCYECHEELIHNPVFLPQDITRFAELVKQRGLNEEQKPDTRNKLAGRVMLLHEVISAGIQALLRDNDRSV